MRLTWIRQCLGLSLKQAKNESTAAEKNTSQDHLQSHENTQESPIFTPDSKHEQLLLYEPKQEFTLVKDGSIPQLQDEREMLIKVTVLGLNPIDWKGPYDSFARQISASRGLLKANNGCTGHSTLDSPVCLVYWVETLQESS